MDALRKILADGEHLFFLLRYAISGVIGGLIQILGLYVWVALLGLEAHYLWGVVLSYLVALAVTFSLQKYWTFRDISHEQIARQVVWYTLISLGNLALNALILHAGKVLIESVGIDFFRFWYLIIQAMAVVVCATLSFFLNRYITFRGAFS